MHRFRTSGCNWAVFCSIALGAGTLEWTHYRLAKERHDTIETIKMLNQNPPGAPGGPPAAAN